MRKNVKRKDLRDSTGGKRGCDGDETCIKFASYGNIIKYLIVRSFSDSNVRRGSGVDGRGWRDFRSLVRRSVSLSSGSCRTAKTALHTADSVLVHVQTQNGIHADLSPVVARAIHPETPPLVWDSGSRTGSAPRCLWQRVCYIR